MALNTSSVWDQPVSIHSALAKTGVPMQPVVRWAMVLVLLVVGTVLPKTAAQEERLQPQRVAIGEGVELSYIERGRGIPVVFIHGTLGDYSVWEEQVHSFAASYRALAYSRRYNYPNTNQPRPAHSAIVEADDLAAFIKKLNLGKVHIVGHSYGAYAALFLAVKHPEVVRTLTLAEPPVVFAGDTVDEAKQRAIKLARTAFERGNAEEAVRAVVDSSEAGKYERIPKPFQQLLLRNAAELKALVTSPEMYPPLDRDAVRKIRIPTLLLSGERSLSSLTSASKELKRLLPEMKCQHVVIPGTDHGMWFEQPEACRQAVLEFIGAQ